MTNGRLAQLACVWDVLAPKAGNVYCGADFNDATWLDFVTSAIVCAPVLDRAPDTGVGETVRKCVVATRDAVGMNTNLGIVLLLAPMCCAANNDDLPRVLDELTQEDAVAVYDAIRLAQPGGLNRAAHADVADAPPADMTLRDAMVAAADRDAVARQYANQFADVTARLAPRIVELLRANGAIDQIIVQVHLEQMAFEPDTLIARKCGEATAAESQRRAQAVLDGDLDFAALDAWLREDGHRRNPGTSADLLVAALFALLRAGRIDAYQNWSRALSFRE